MNVKEYITTALFLMFFIGAASASQVNIGIIKSKQQEWRLTYQLSEPATKLAFVRNPDDSRTTRWLPVTPGFTISIADGQEYLQRDDGAKFDSVTVRLTPTYKHLSKDYAPFSPYSDGGTLIYTGRLFACINTCEGDENQWPITMQVPKGEHMLVNGKLYPDKAFWVDSNDGMNVYVGTQQPVETENVWAIVDAGLPDNIKQSLDADIPELMHYFEQRLGKNQGQKPALFASYANVDGHSSQGGTLPNQIFMHWNLNDLGDKVADDTFLNNTIWFFAHEVAHLYQRSKNAEILGSPNESWLHEGHADWLAAKALLALYPQTTSYVENKIARFKSHCAAGLENMTLRSAADNGRFDLYYTCGLLIHQAIEEEFKKHGNKDSFSAWEDFRTLAEKQGEHEASGFLNVVKANTSEAFVAKITSFITEQQENPVQALDLLNAR